MTPVLVSLHCFPVRLTVFKILQFVLKTLHDQAYGFTLNACGVTLCLSPFSHLAGGICLCQDDTDIHAFGIHSSFMFGQLSPSTC